MIPDSVPEVVFNLHLCPSLSLGHIKVLMSVVKCLACEGYVLILLLSNLEACT